MAWDDIKHTNDQLTSSEWNTHVDDQKSRAKVEYGSGAPTSTPSMVGAIYIDTDTGDKYIAVGTSSSSDWQKITDKTDFENHFSDFELFWYSKPINLLRNHGLLVL